MLVDRYDGFLIDLDGVVYVGDEEVTGARETVERLRDREIPFCFVTNTSSKTREEILAVLDGVGIDAALEEIVSAAWATGQFLQGVGVESVYPLGNDSLQAELRRAGIRIVEGDPEAVEEADPNSVENADPDAVVVGHDESLTYADLVVATRLLHGGDREFVAVNVDGAVPKADGIVPGAGAVAAAVEAATGVAPTVVGKPEPRLFEIATETLGVEDVAMVGDNPRVDVRGANRLGIGSILVTAHATRRVGDGEEAMPDHEIPDLCGLFE